MILLLDLGNTRMKWAFLEGEHLLHPGAAPRHGGDPFAALAALPVPSQVVVASVAGAGTDQALAEWIAVRWHLNPRFLHSESHCAGVSNGYREPARLGVDRWLALLGARAEAPGWAVVVDAGTAVTIDVLDPQGAHQGGLILPGIELMRQSLFAGTSGVAAGVDADPPAAGLLGRSTGEGVGHGTVLAVIGCCREVLRALAANQPLTCLLTGGDAERLLPLLQGQAGVALHLAPSLVLQGMARWLQCEQSVSGACEDPGE